jgi:hypothetical protein
LKCFLEAPNRFAEGTPKIAELTRSKDDQHDDQNDQQVHRLKKTLKHIVVSFYFFQAYMIFLILSNLFGDAIGKLEADAMNCLNTLLPG